MYLIRIKLKINDIILLCLNSRIEYYGGYLKKYVTIYMNDKFFKSISMHLFVEFMDSLMTICRMQKTG